VIYPSADFTWDGEEVPDPKPSWMRREYLKFSEGEKQVHRRFEWRNTMYPPEKGQNTPSIPLTASSHQNTVRHTPWRCEKAMQTTILG
jgi:hypothetical protein